MSVLREAGGCRLGTSSCVGGGKGAALATASARRPWRGAAGGCDSRAAGGGQDWRATGATESRAGGTESRAGGAESRGGGTESRPAMEGAPRSLGAFAWTVSGRASRGGAEGRSAGRGRELVRGTPNADGRRLRVREELPPPSRFPSALGRACVPVCVGSSRSVDAVRSEEGSVRCVRISLLLSPWPRIMHGFAAKNSEFCETSRETPRDRRQLRAKASDRHAAHPSRK